MVPDTYFSAVAKFNYKTLGGSAWGHALLGRSNLTNYRWAQGGSMRRQYAYPIYGLSSMITVPDEDPPVAPEPATLAIWSVLGMVGVGAGRWRRHKAKA